MDLSIVIVSWNTRELLRQCLDSVFAESTNLALEVFVVDNASADGSPAMVREFFSQVRLIENPKNVGFAPANNQVFPLCRAPAILLLNSDTIVKADALRVMVTFLSEHPRVGVVGPKLLHPQAKLSVLGCGRQTTLRTLFNHYFFLARLFPRVRAFEGVYHYVGVHDRAPRAVGWVSGACLMVRKSIVEESGGLSERWFMYAEDIEWCARILQQGWEIYQAPQAVVEHYLSASTEMNADVSMMPITASRDLYIQLSHPSATQLFLYDAIRVCGLAMRSIGYWIRGLSGPPGDRKLWHQKARVYRAYTAAAAPGLASHSST